LSVVRGPPSVVSLCEVGIPYCKCRTSAFLGAAFAALASVLLSLAPASAQSGAPIKIGFSMAPWAYAQLQVMQQAIAATKSLDDGKLADHIRANSFKTMVGDVKFGAKGEWAQSRVLQVQFQNIKGNDVGQFKDVSTQAVVAPAEYESGKLIYPYEKAK